MKIQFNYGWYEHPWFDTYRNGKINGSRGMCNYIELGIELDFTKNTYAPKPEVKPVKKVGSQANLRNQNVQIMVMPK